MEVNKMPKLGFGMMRLPKKEDGSIDLENTTELFDRLMSVGLNYFDTAYFYHAGESESVIKEVLVKRYPRESFYVTDKLPIWYVKDGLTKEVIFEDQLKKTGLDYFDFYLLHGVENSNIQKYEENQCFEWGLKLKEEGKVKNFGFSFHGTPELLEELLMKYPFVDIVQIQLNYIDLENPRVQSRACYEVLEKFDKPVLVMEPLKAGALASMSPSIEQMFKEKRPNNSIASWALRFVLSHKNVVTVLSGMPEKEHLEDNIKTVTNFEKIDDAEYQLILQAVKALEKENKIPCTKCQYCMDGCPMKIQIPEIIQCINNRKVLKEKHPPQTKYNQMIQVSGKASDCIQCGQCESVCPQHLNITEYLKEASDLFEKK